jgi:hypothetical protein
MNFIHMGSAMSSVVDPAVLSRYLRNPAPLKSILKSISAIASSAVRPTGWNRNVGCAGYLAVD